MELMIKPSTGDKAFTALVCEGGATIGVASWGSPGYAPTGELYRTRDEAKAEADRRNAVIGLTERDALAIVLSSMRTQR